MRKDILKMCIEIEVEVSRIYKALIDYFPEFEREWRELSAEEENHAMILNMASDYKSIGLLKEELVPQLLSDLDESLSLIEELETRIYNHTISLEELIDKLIFLEKTMAESFLQESMTKEEGSEIFLKLKRLYLTEEAHEKRLARLKKKIGFKQ
ncbi:MAG: hypothetical protein OHK0040_03300 [bacterium]